MHQDMLDQVFLHRKDPPKTDTTSDCPANRAASPAMADEKAPADACPVDHKAREAWLNSQAAHPLPARDTTAPANTTKTASSWSWRIPFYSSPPPTTTQTPDAATTTLPPAHPSLGTTRQISSIPRSSQPGDTSCPANTEAETGASASGNWVYPSEQQFFAAMRRKGHAARADDMATVVPIHNAVNERAWAEILRWEQPFLQGAQCGGPKLHSFSGDSARMTPKARVNTILGYQAPFDRHDWVVDRCGTKVEYVIDFYKGRDDGSSGKPSFYLDVRPKINSWEGIKMRTLKGLGLV
jgi:cytochrome c heme-lyase